MASAWVERITNDGTVRYRVRCRIGGRESKPVYLGRFHRKQDAVARKNWALGELAAMRVPDLTNWTKPKEPDPVLTFKDTVEQWLASRIDTRASTALQHRTSLARASTLNHLDVQAITVADITAVITGLHETGRAPETIRKTIQAVAMVLDFAGRTPNPARDKQNIRIPNSEKGEPTPPDTTSVEAVAHRLAIPYLVALATLDMTGARVGELETARLGDFDEDNHRWLVRAEQNKNRRSEWRVLHDDMVNGTAVVEVLADRLPAREDRDPEQPLFVGINPARLRTAIYRACRDAGVPQFSPHDLRHRRISLLHAQGVSWARIGERVGQRNIALTANTYTHVLTDGREIDWSELLVRAHRVVPNVVPIRT